MSAVEKGRLAELIISVRKGECSIHEVEKLLMEVSPDATSLALEVESNEE